MLYGLKPYIIEAIKSVFLRYPAIEKVVLYGSRAKGDYTNGSDIDLTCLGEGLTLSLIHQIENDIDDLLLPYSFDISIYQQIDNENLLAHIERVGVVFYESKTSHHT